MNKSIVVMAGLLFMSGLVFAAGGGQRTYDRWTDIIGNTQEAYDNLKNWDTENTDVDYTAELGQLEVEINTMRTVQANFDPTGKRWDQEEKIWDFIDATSRARGIITPILVENHLDRSWNNLRGE